jgi:cytochrome c-type biogenesis protein
MDSQSIPAYLAFLAGVLSFISPCHLPLVPVYLGYLGNSTSIEGRAGRTRTVAYTVVFVLGYTIILVALGASAGIIGQSARQWIPATRRIGGGFIILLGIHVSGLVRLPMLAQEKRFDFGGSFRPGYWSSFVLGMLFGLAWTPCIGPLVAGILLLAGSTATLGQGAFLLSIYALGLGIPFILAAILMGTATGFIQTLSRHSRAVSMASGLLLVVMGVMVFTDQLARLSGFFSWMPVR